MDVGQLINMLNRLPKTLNVYVDFESCGMEDARGIDIVIVHRRANNSHCCGDHEAVAEIKSHEFINNVEAYKERGDIGVVITASE